MCGIAGFTGKKNTEVLKKMLTSIAHRGPDGEGMFEGDEFSIGMRRLAIIDVNGGYQPIWNEDKTVAIVFNGEIYNYEELWSELKGLGHKFTTDHSDTEAIVHGYEQWGVDVLQKLRGMFAFAIYDLKKKQLFIARDRLGIKPLYYTFDKGNLYFSSEIKAILQAAPNKRNVNKQILYEYLRFRTHDHKEDTFFDGIKHLQPGHYMILNSDGPIKEINQYWKLDVNTEFSGNLSDDEYANQLKDLFIDTTRLHLISDVPVGVALSGGLDSSGVISVTQMLREQNKSTTHTKELLAFSAVFPNNSIDESKYINIAKDHAHAHLYTVTPDVDEFWKEINDWIYTQEEPTISSAPYAGFCVMRKAHEYVTVMLSGQGGDEIFAGYLPYFASYAKSAVRAGRVDKFLLEFVRGFDLYKSYLTLGITKKLTNKNFLTMDELLHLDNQVDTKYVIDSNLNKRLAADTTMYSVPNILRYEDKNAMRFSIETRVPFLDHVFVEYAFSLPIDLKIKHGWNRYVYRKAMKGIIPESILKRRKKIGFTTPEIQWLKAKSKTITDIFSASDLYVKPIVNQQKLVTSFNEWLSGKRRGDGMIFWRILNTELWMRRFDLSI